MRLKNLFYPPPAPPGFGKGKVLPEASASWLSRLSFHWLGSFLNVGFSRPLEKDDFWELPETRHTGVLTDIVEQNYFARCPPQKRPRHMRDGGEDSSTQTSESEKEAKEGGAPETASPPTAPVYDESLFKALLQSFKKRIWFSSLLLVASDTLRTTTPLVNKVLITWLTESFVFSRLSASEKDEATAAGFKPPRGVGYGIGLAFALFVMQEAASVMSNHYMISGMTTGLYLRTGITGAIFRKSLRLSGKSRAEHTVGKITTLISTDVARLDSFAWLGPYLWAAPVQLILGIGLLIGTLGYSALVGLGVLILSLPVQGILVAIMMNQTKKGVKITDKRVRLTTEVMQGIRLIKVYGWEAFYTSRIIGFRREEIKRIRKASFAMALLVAMFSFTPELAAILSFITYALTKHDLNIAVIFTSLQLFNVIRVPMLLIPFSLSGLSDALVSLGRLSEFLTAEELGEPYRIEPSQSLAVKVDASFEWENVVKLEAESKDNPQAKIKAAKEKKEQKKKEKAAKKKKVEVPGTETSEKAEVQAEPGTSPEAPEEKPFCLEDLHLEIRKGDFVAIVGRVGSGKSSILQALIGEMKRTRGEVVFGGTMAYVPQNPWIKNATLRENILFGQKDDVDRFSEIIRTCSLEHDLEILPQADRTEIGEKGINLSGGQKARVSLARAAYSAADIVLLDDPLSALDSYVGKKILEDCILEGPFAKRTRILVTHSLHVLDHTDFIYVVDNGKIVEQGTYSELMSQSGMFTRLIEEYGNTEGQQGSTRTKGRSSQEAKEGNSDKQELDAALMQAEERMTGAVSWRVYSKYLENAGGIIWAPVILLLLLLTQANNVATTLFLGFWTGETIHNFTQGDYMAVYAGLGASAAALSFLLTYAFIIIGLFASLNLYKGALGGVLHSRVSFFDTTPMGRIVNRLSKDQEVIDTQLPIILMQFLSAFSSVIGTVGLVFYAFPYLGIIFPPLVVLYYAASVYYRRSSVEAKRLDSLFRSFMYGSYTETLTGLPTIRAYGRQDRSVKDAQENLDMENRAYLMTVVMQRWLAVRLDFFANVLVLGIGLFAAGFRNSVNPSKISVVLSYTLSATQVFSEMISLFAQSEQNMNAVERVLHYSELPPESGKVDPVDPPESWPEDGAVTFDRVSMAYRENLPTVLKGISFQISAREKVGVVGRTGSGKSSLIQALLRMVELQEGRIDIDGLDISGVPLETLRRRIAFVPQDSTLFLGTLRDNLDPQSLRTDAELISIIQRCGLLPKEGTVDAAAEAKFSLDSTVGDEGSNYSAGEKQLLALCRALVKNSRIIILDEATSSVDAETDTKLQRTIREEFASSTLICIAHRLNTIAHYDRIIVMDNGVVAEFDTVLNLFDRPDSIFRSLCDEAHLTRADILKLRRDHDGLTESSLSL
ncbi:multidrug resistance-associated ABC transporter [Agrocybe pediades]|nr:multidrug resistance-associated ABC transporter [Agrocybe pediades]